MGCRKTEVNADQGQCEFGSTTSCMDAQLIEGLKINYGQIIEDELFMRAHKTSSALPFPCLITEPCRQVDVPIFQGINNEFRAIKRQDIKKTRDKNKFEMRVHKTPSFGTQSQPTPKVSDAPSVCQLPLGTIILYGTLAVSGSMPTPPTTDTIDIASMPPSYLEQRLIQQNFGKMVKDQKKFEWQLNVWAKQFKPLVEKVVTESLKPYENLYAQIDDM